LSETILKNNNNVNLGIEKSLKYTLSIEQVRRSDWTETNVIRNLVR